MSLAGDAEHDDPQQDEPTPVGDAVELSDDVYEQIVRQVQEIAQTVDDGLGRTAKEFEPVPPQPAIEAPLAPESLQEAGLTLGQISSLILKLTYLHGSLSGFEFSRQLRLPFSVVDEGLEFLQAERQLEVKSADVAGRLSFRYLLTDAGRGRARDAFEECRYVGPAPVPLGDYAKVCQRQSLQFANVDRNALKAVFRKIVVDDLLVNRIGSAISGGRSLFLYGPPGNGKTLISKAIGRYLNESGGDIYVPYALSVDNQIITVYDPTVHLQRPSMLTTDTFPNQNGDDEASEDTRWVKVKRPVIIAGGEFRIEMLDLSHNVTSGYYTAPLHVKANGGLFLLDDFGRQLVPPKELLNRWILPLEDRRDYLTLSTGKKFAVPFEQLMVFSTNLEPNELVDEAFLRRIRHKIEVSPPTESQYRQIFRQCCEDRAVKFDDWVVTQLLTSHYNAQILPKSSDPRDLLDIIEGICRFKGERVHLSEELLSEAFTECLGTLQLSSSA